jgi:hypothetical protein
MGLVALVTEGASVRRFLRGVGEATEAPARVFARGPPYRRSRVLRRAAGEVSLASRRNHAERGPGDVCAQGRATSRGRGSGGFAASSGGVGGSAGGRDARRPEGRMGRAVNRRLKCLAPSGALLSPPDRPRISERLGRASSTHGTEPGRASHLPRASAAREPRPMRPGRHSKPPFLSRRTRPSSSTTSTDSPRCSRASAGSAGRAEQGPGGRARLRATLWWQQRQGFRNHLFLFLRAGGNGRPESGHGDSFPRSRG